MWDFTKYTFKCPYCEHEYEEVVGHGITYKYENDFYDLYECPSCKREFLGKYQNGIFIKMPEKSQLQYSGIWMS